MPQVYDPWSKQTVSMAQSEADKISSDPTYAEKGWKVTPDPTPITSNIGIGYTTPAKTPDQISNEKRLGYGETPIAQPVPVTPIPKPTPVETPVVAPVTTPVVAPVTAQQPAKKLRDVATEKGYQVNYDAKTNQLSVTNPQTGRTVSVQSGQGQQYGLGGLVNGSNVVADTNKLDLLLSGNVPTLREVAENYAWKIDFDQNTGMVSITNKGNGKTISFKSGEGQQYGFGGLVNGYNVVTDINKLRQELNAPIGEKPLEDKKTTPEGGVIPPVTPRETFEEQTKRKAEEIIPQTNTAQVMQLLKDVNTNSKTMLDEFNANNKVILDRVNASFSTPFQWNQENDAGFKVAQQKLTREYMNEMDRLGIVNSDIAASMLVDKTQELKAQYEALAQRRYNENIDNMLKQGRFNQEITKDSYNAFAEYNKGLYNNIDVLRQTSQDDLNRTKDVLNEMNNILTRKMDAEKTELAKDKVKREIALARVKAQGYYDNESALLFGVEPGTLSEEVQDSVRKIKEYQQQKRMDLEKESKMEKIKHENNLEELQLKEDMKNVQTIEDKNYTKMLAFSLTTTSSGLEQYLQKYPDTANMLGHANMEKMYKLIVDKQKQEQDYADKRASERRAEEIDIRAEKRDIRAEKREIRAEEKDKRAEKKDKTPKESKMLNEVISNMGKRIAERKKEYDEFRGREVDAGPVYTKEENIGYLGKQYESGNIDEAEFDKVRSLFNITDKDLEKYERENRVYIYNEQTRPYTIEELTGRSKK